MRFAQLPCLLLTVAPTLLLRPPTMCTPKGGGVRTLGLCPPTPNCISTAEELNDIGHYAPPL
jgi:hypothetical protein